MAPGEHGDRRVAQALHQGTQPGVADAVRQQEVGREAVLVHYPELVDTESWRLTSAWLQDYGLVALAVIAGSPLPQTPAIFFYSLADPSVPGVLLAVGLGKTVKYVFLAWLTARFPARFIHYR